MRILLACLCIVSTLITSCGTKGPLYLPEKQYPQETPAKK